MLVAQFQRKLPPAELTRETFPYRNGESDDFSQNKEIEGMSKDQVEGKIVLALLAYLNGET